MNLVADENLDKSLVERLRSDGHEVLYAAEIEPAADDAAILAHANNRQAVLITEDKDFGELVFRQRLVHGGVILVRLMGLSGSAKAEIVSQAIGQHAEEFPRAFSVIAPGMLRIRRSLE